MSSPSSANRTAILLMALSMATISTNDAIMRGLTGHVPVGELIAGRGAFLCGVLLVLCAVLKQRISVASVFEKWAVVRGVADLLATALFVASLSQVPISVATTLAFSSPILLTALSGPLFGERPGKWRWLAVIGGFIGVLLVTAPGTDAWNPALLLVVGTAVFVAAREVVTRWVPEHVSSGSTAMSTAVVAVLGGLVTLPFGWVPVTGYEIGRMAGASVLLGISFVALVISLRMGELSLVSPVQYTAILWAVFYGALIWDEWPGTREIIGGLIIVAAGLLIVYREQVQRAKMAERSLDREKRQ